MLAVAAAMLFATAPVLAQQQSATIRGTVTGPDGQAFPGATVTLLDQLGTRPFPYWARNELAWVGEAIELGFTGSLPSITS